MPAAGRLGDKAQAQSDSHGCPACPHTTVGPAILGSADVSINNLPALRVGDNGIATPCCGTNTWTARKGADSVFINGRGTYRKDDDSTHCGGAGKLIEGSPDVEVGDSRPEASGASVAQANSELYAGGDAPGAANDEPVPEAAAGKSESAAGGAVGADPAPDTAETERSWVSFRILLGDMPIGDFPVEFQDSAGQRHKGKTDRQGVVHFHDIAPGPGKLRQEGE